MTAKELIEELQQLHPDTEIDFSPVNFYRLHMRGEKFVHFEFDEKQVAEFGRYIILEKPPI